MSGNDTNGGYVTNARLAEKLDDKFRAVRWEFRCLLALSSAANLTIAYGFGIPPVPQAVHFALGMF